MPSPTPWSRFFFGSLLTVATASIVVVVFSRPSVSKQDARLLWSEPERSGEGTNGVKSLLDRTSVGRRKQRDMAVQGAELPERVTAEPKEPDATRLDVESSAIRSAAETAEISAAPTPTSPADNPPQNAAPQPPRRRTRTTQAARQNQEKPATVTTKKRPDEKTEEKASRSERDPMKALSREFARRRAAAAAKQAQKEMATVVSPPAHEIIRPIVAMSQEHRQACLVFVGDDMPDISLADLAGDKHEIRQSLGKALTVIVCWEAANPYALDEFEEIPHDLVPLNELGVETIAIHVGPAPENYETLCREYGGSVLCLLDPDRQYYERLAQNRLPRTYLLDAEGKIVWLDMEYSRTTRYELRNAIHFYLQK